jgi:hypothetical protein
MARMGIVPYLNMTSFTFQFWGFIYMSWHDLSLEALFDLLSHFFGHQRGLPNLSNLFSSPFNMPTWVHANMGTKLKPLWCFPSQVFSTTFIFTHCNWFQQNVTWLLFSLGSFGSEPIQHTTWHLFLLFSEWCFFFPIQRGRGRHSWNTRTLHL